MLIRIIYKVQDWVLYVLSIMMLIVLIIVTIQTGIALVNNFILSDRGYTDLNIVFEILGLFLTVLIVVELAENIIAYLKDHILNVEVAVTTALIAISRKLIIFNSNDDTYMKLIGLGVAVLALSISYYLLQRVKVEKLDKFIPRARPDSILARNKN